jgi:ABC-type transport system involved in cytochrome c biogenesis permease component
MKAWFSFIRNDFRLMARAPENIWAMLLFGLLVLIVFHFSLPAELSQSVFVGSSGMMLSLLFSAILGLPPLQHHPNAIRFLPQFVTGNLGPVAYFWGKVTVGLVVLVVSSAIIYPVTILLFNFPMSSRLLWGAVVLGVGLIGITVVVTVVSAITVGRESWLLPVLAFPLLFPVVLATSRIIRGTVTARNSVPESWVHLLVSYDLLMVFGSWFLSEFFWEELPEIT